MIEKPQPPGDYECCESACDPCVWDIYFEDLKEWKAQQADTSLKDKTKSVAGTESDQSD